MGKREEPGTVTVVNWCQVLNWCQVVSTSLLAMLLTLLTGMTPIFYMGISKSITPGTLVTVKPKMIPEFCEQQGNKGSRKA